ncbi:phage tail protein I [Pseudomonas costantinii]|uniref:Phage tail protein I n=1 Tax=Pseudomonas costantinii TaxID=168469 RepID=A0A1S2UBT4_9PSED|nr:phage tail protein I [Pseudomonas costantinii]NVZ18206.1 phage tail protein I [Pseudomonas costantinii]OIN43894.1 phage tail protein I [Pseudomonas costantinii]SEE25965.1 phage tail protein, P2 protein I family [Pseudomonas costantinii]
MNDEPKASLLPANSSPLEKALDLGFGKLLERVIPPFPALMSPLQTPTEFLPYLAADRGVSEWDASASEAEKRLTVALSWQIQRQAGTPKALSYAVESLGFTPNISAWYQQRPLGVPYTFDVQAIIGRSWSSGDHNRLIRRINAAQSERDRATITVVHETEGQLAFTQMLHAPFSDGELYLDGALPELALVARLNSAGVAQHYTINDYDLRAQP